MSVLCQDKNKYNNSLSIHKSCLDSLPRGAFTCHQESPLCTWLCHCRRYHSSLTHQTPAMCSRRRYSRCPLRRRSSKLSRCVLHEAWSKAEEMALSSTYWCLRRNKSVGGIIYAALWLRGKQNQSGLSWFTNSPVLKTWTSCRAPIALQPPQTKILLSETVRAVWNLDGQGGISICAMCFDVKQRDTIVQKGRIVHDMLPDGHVYHIPQGWSALYSPSRQWWHVSILHSCVLHKSFPH